MLLGLQFADLVAIYLLDIPFRDVYLASEFFVGF